MNKRLFFLGLISILAVLASCQREMDWSDTPEIRATVEEQPETKTYLYSGAGAIYWSPADKIDVFFGTTRATYTSQNTLNSKTAVFKTNDSIGSSELSSTNIWGLYPSNSSSSCNGSSVTTTLPSTQYGVPNTFDDDLFLAVAHSTSTSLQFYNVCGGIKFNLAYDDIKKITFRGNNNENLAGKVSISFESGVPKATIVSGVKEITLTPKTGTTFAKGVDYYITLLPGTLSSGFKMTFTTTNGTTGTFNYTDNPVTIKRSVFSKKSNMDAYASFGDERQPSNVIYYTSTDGKVVTPYKTDVFGANIVSNEYVGGKGIITFEGAVTSIGGHAFDYRPRLTSIDIPNSVTSIGNSAFYGCSSLSSINIPESVTSIGEDAFERCSSLTLINLPKSVTSIGIFAFYGCSSLSSIIIPESVRSIGDCTFDGCCSLSSIDLPKSITSIGRNAFGGCSNLSSIDIPKSVTSIGEGAFIGCSSLTSIIVDAGNPIYDSRNNCNAIIETSTNILVAGCSKTVFPNTVTSIGNSAFYGCSNLTSMAIPYSVTSIGQGSFYYCSSLTSIEIPESVKSIGNGAFDYCSSLTSITVKASTPPSLEDNVFRNTNNCPIYVPAGSVDAYKSAWSVYSDRIQAIQPSFQASYFDIRTQGLTIQLSNQHGIYSVPLLNAVTITDDGRNQILSNGIWLTGNGQNGIPDGVTATDYYNIYYNIEFDTYSLPSDLRELVTLELDNNDQLAFVFDYSKTDKTFTGTYTVPFLIRFNTDLGSYNAMFDLVIKGEQ